MFSTDSPPVTRGCVDASALAGFESALVGETNGQLKAIPAAKDFDMQEAVKPIWFGDMNLDTLRTAHVGTLTDHMGIEFVEVGPDFIRGRMPAEARNFQPYGIIHGGASVVLAETLGSCGAAWSVNPETHRAFGQEVNANHLRPVSEGWVNGIARPVHRGRRSQVWSIDLTDDKGRATCIARLTMAVIAL
ncbi:MAG: hotdog fold thioesterase [Paracoccaceae bacterium]